MLARVCGLVLAFFKLKITNILKSSGWGLEKSELPWEQNFYSHRCPIGAFPVELLDYQVFNGLHCKLAKIALLVYSIFNWVDCMTSSIISFVLSWNSM